MAATPSVVPKKVPTVNPGPVVVPTTVEGSVC